MREPMMWSIQRAGDSLDEKEGIGRNDERYITGGGIEKGLLAQKSMKYRLR
jgi:hypothetical protein